jgi:hypothetical protein
MFSCPVDSRNENLISPVLASSFRATKILANGTSLGKKNAKGLKQTTNGPVMNLQELTVRCQIPTAFLALPSTKKCFDDGGVETNFPTPCSIANHD